MLFTLEALEARHGDALILHYGPSGSPRFILIDGGPAGVFRDSLRPRLDALKHRWSPDEPLPLQMMMVSHIDDDHINGVLALMGRLVDQRDDGRPLSYNVLALWHNSFDDILGNRDDELFSRLGASVAAAGLALPSGFNLSLPAALVVASIQQGRELRSHAARLGLQVNRPFTGLVLARTGDRTVIDWGDGLTLTVLGPRQDRIEALHRAWEAEIRRRGWATEEDAQALAAAYADTSVFNLSSIVVLAELQGKRILLTGDARGDDILVGLRNAGLLGGGTLHIDVLKLPHHGSDRNVETNFFRQITADHYVVSGNGEHDNPEISTLQMISTARGDADFAIHLTNRQGKNNLGKRLRDFFDAEKARGKKYEPFFRPDDERSLKVDLLDPVED